MKKLAAGAASMAVRLLATAAALSLLLPAARAAPQAPITSLIVDRPEADILLLALRIDRELLTDALPMYEARGGSGVLVPLGEMCRLLELGITVDTARGVGNGFFITEGRLFSLDVASREVIVEGKSKRFDPSAIELHSDDIYVDAALLAEWLPLHLNVDRHGSMVTVVPTEKLPLQLRFERERKFELARASRPPPASYPRLELPYRLFDGPFIDLTLGISKRPLAGGHSQTDVTNSLYATGDVLFMAASAFVARTEHGILNARASLSRKDPDGHLLGALHAREVTVGDVFHPGLDLIALPRSGPGVLVSSFPLQLPTQFDHQSFRGDLPPGWEVELYRGGELLAHTGSRLDGLYEFFDVPLLFGLNVFRLEFYGPQGQHRSESQLLNVDETLTPKGKAYYRLAGNDPGLRLPGLPREDVSDRSSFELSFGLAKHLSASASASTVDMADRRRSYGKAGLRAFWGFLFANVDLARDQSGGSAWQATLSSRRGVFGFLLQHAALDEFVSEQFVSPAGPLSSRTKLRIDTALPETFLPRIPLIVELRQDRLASGGSISEINGRASAFRRGFSVANELRWTFASGGGAQSPSTASGQFLVSRYLQAFAIRGTADYDLKPIRQTKSLAVTGETRLVRNLLISTGISRLMRVDQTRYLAGVSKLEGAFGFGVTVDYARREGLGASVLLSLGLGRDGRNGKWHAQARALAASGGLSGRAFLDTNGNERLDADEKPIAGAGFLLNGTGNLARTDAAGEAFIPNLTPYRDLDIALATSTLEDPFWKPAHKGVRFAPRPGRVAVIDFPVVVYGEVTGTVYLKRDGKTIEARDVELELVDSHGVVVRKIRSGYDGFYDLNEIEPGHYTLRVAAQQIEPLRVATSPSRELEIAASGTVMDGVRFVLDVE